MKRTAFYFWKNTSEFPDAWARPVCEWIAERLGVPANSKEIVIRHTSRGGHGHAGGRRIVCSIARRKWRRDWKYAGMKHDNDYKVASPFEAFVFLAAHEIYHECPAGRALYREQKNSGKAHWRQAMEFRTQRAAWDVMLAFRAERGRFISAYRRERAAERNRANRMKLAKATKNTPEYKLQQAEKRLAEWTTRRDRAERMVKKWKAKVNRTRAAIAVRDRKRMAATPAEANR